MRTLYLLAAASAVGAMAVPAAAQSSYPYQSYPVQADPYAQPVPQPYPGQPGYGYAQPGYAQPYGSTNPVEQIINQLLGNNNAYTVSDRTQVSRCATAAVAQAQSQYQSRYGAYGQQGYAYGQQGYDPRYPNSRYANAYSQMRVTAITNVERRRYNSLRVTGLISSGTYAQPYGNAYGYHGQAYADPRYAQAADLSFRCNVDSRGAVTGVRINRSDAAYRR
jgi:hypothetical protein